jgi:hypothetical protein
MHMKSMEQSLTTNFYALYDAESAILSTENVKNCT